MIRVITPCRDKREEFAIREHVASVVTVPHVHVCKVGPEIARNRNYAIDDWTGDILCWDSDIRATTAQFQRITSHGDAVAGGAYRHRGGPHFVAGVAGAAAGLSDCLVGVDTTGLRPVEWVGAGFMFVPGRILREMEKPFFRHIIVGEDLTSEDVGFCFGVKDAGFMVYLDCDCVVDHLNAGGLKMKLGVVDRLIIMNALCPKQGGETTLLISRDIIKKVSPTTEELAELQRRESESLPMVDANFNPEIDVEFSSSEIKVLKDSKDKLGKEEKLRIEWIDTVQKIFG